MSLHYPYLYLNRRYDDQRAGPHSPTRRNTPQRPPSDREKVKPQARRRSVATQALWTFTRGPAPQSKVRQGLGHGAKGVIAPQEGPVTQHRITLSLHYITSHYSVM